MTSAQDGRHPGAERQGGAAAGVHRHHRHPAVLQVRLHRSPSAAAAPAQTACSVSRAAGSLFMWSLFGESERMDQLKEWNRFVWNTKNNVRLTEHQWSQKLLCGHMTRASLWSHDQSFRADWDQPAADETLRECPEDKTHNPTEKLEIQL